MIEGKSRSGSVAIGVLKALHLLHAANRPTTLEAICDWLYGSEHFYYDDWLIVAGRSASEYLADILADLHDLGVVHEVELHSEDHPHTLTVWRRCLEPTG